MGPFNEQPVLWPGRATQLITMRRGEPRRREMEASLLCHALAAGLMRPIVDDKRRECIDMAARSRVTGNDPASMLADWEELLQLPALSPIGSNKVSPG